MSDSFFSSFVTEDSTGSTEYTLPHLVVSLIFLKNCPMDMPIY